MALRQQAQQLGVVSALDGPEPRGAQCGDRDRAGVVGVVLVGSLRVEHPDPSRQRRWHVDNVLARVDELLGEQVAETACRLDCPGAPTERRCPLAQTLDLPDRRSDRDATSSSSVSRIATAVWVALWGSTPMITPMVPPSVLGGHREGTPHSAGWC